MTTGERAGEQAESKAAGLSDLATPEHWLEYAAWVDAPLLSRLGLGLVGGTGGEFGGGGDFFLFLFT